MDGASSFRPSPKEGRQGATNNELVALYNLGLGQLEGSSSE
jgi:hypothetical protein